MEDDINLSSISGLDFSCDLITTSFSFCSQLIVVLLVVISGASYVVKCLLVGQNMTHDPSILNIQLFLIDCEMFGH